MKCRRIFQALWTPSWVMMTSSWILPYPPWVSPLGQRVAQEPVWYPEQFRGTWGGPWLRHHESWWRHIEESALTRRFPAIRRQCPPESWCSDTTNTSKWPLRNPSLNFWICCCSFCYFCCLFKELLDDLERLDVCDAVHTVAAHVEARHRRARSDRWWRHHDEANWKE